MRISIVSPIEAHHALLTRCPGRPPTASGDRPVPRQGERLRPVAGASPALFVAEEPESDTQLTRRWTRTRSAPDDKLLLGATGNAAAIARILALHVARMVVANPRRLSGVVGPRAKTDRLDARALARLLAGGI
jgi:hypothetical protein